MWTRNASTLEYLQIKDMTFRLRLHFSDAILQQHWLYWAAPEF
jgi:hypothetical protein